MGDGVVRLLREARSVAIVGASDDPQRIGGRPLRYLVAAGYDGTIYPVNPTRSHVQGLPSFPSLEAVPERPDLVIVAVAREQAVPVVEACGRLGVPAAIVFAAGYAETDEAGRCAQEDLRAAAVAHGVRILGPNCNGVISPAHRAMFAFTPVLADGPPPAGGLAIASQSAAVGTYWLRRIRERGLGMHSLVHTGNEADIGLDDVLADQLADPSVRVILCALEQWRRPERLQPVLDAIAASARPVVVLPLGQTPVGRAAAASHTGGLVARRTDVVTGLLRQAGAQIAEGLEDALLLGTTLELLPRTGRRVAIITPSGGLGVLMADALSTRGFALPAMPDDLQAAWRDLVPFCGPRNPIDVTAQLVNRPELYDRFVGDVVTSGRIDLLVAFMPHAAPHDAFAQAIVGWAERAAGAGVGLVAVGSMASATAGWFREAGIPTFLDPSEAARILARIPGAAPDGLATDASLRVEPIVVPRGDGALTGDELETKRLLADAGHDVVDDHPAATAEAAGEVADRIGYPVALKLRAAGLAHKAKAGGVALGLRHRDDVVAAGAAMLARAAGSAGGTASLLVEPMVTGDELIVGATNDPDWGPLAVIGRGGVDVEDEAAVAFRRLPVTDAMVADAIDEIPGLRLVLGRKAEQSIPAIRALLHTLHGMLLEPGVRSVELNPVMVGPDGSAVVVDALLEWQGTPDSNGHEEA